MDLAEYRTVNGLTLEALARQLGLSGKSVAQKYCKGEHWPDTVTLERILRVTNNKVTLEAMHKRRLLWLQKREEARRHARQAA